MFSCYDSAYVKQTIYNDLKYSSWLFPLGEELKSYIRV